MNVARSIYSANFDESLITELTSFVPERTVASQINTCYLTPLRLAAIFPTPFRCAHCTGTTPYSSPFSVFLCASTAFMRPRPDSLILFFVASFFLVALLILRLQTLEQLFQLLVCCLELTILRLDGIFEVSDRHGHECIHLFFLLVVTQIKIRRSARWAEAFFGKGLQGLQVPTTFVIFQIVRIAILDGWISLDTNLLTQIFARSRAIDICNQN